MRRIMENVVIREEYPTPEEYQAVRQAVGWTLPESQAIADCLRRSSYCLCARRNGELVGMARIVGDGELVHYIQDVIVIPACQGEGIGKRLMDRIMEYVRRHAVRHTIVGLMAARGKEPFYERYGFFARPNGTFGAGMTIFWDEDAAAARIEKDTP
jgi:GNAT superfamily N-acetyltransferase